MVLIVIILAATLAIVLLRMRVLGRRFDEVRRAEQMKTTYIQNLSHEVRTSLHSVSGLAEYFAKEDLYLSKQDKRSLADLIKFNANQIKTLLEELDTFSINGEGHQKEIEEFSPNALCLRCLQVAERSKTNEGVNIGFRRQLPDTYLLKSDPRILEVIISKLVACSQRFTEHGDITISCFANEAERRFCFSVEDTGSGIPQDRRNNLFNWFDKPDELNNSVELDLSIIQKMAGKLSGFIQQDTLYTRGTRMVLTLPLSSPL